jgi:hypothetical protein
MERFDREELKKDHPYWIKRIQEDHIMGPEIEQELFVNNTPVKNLGHSRVYFVILATRGLDDMYMSYEMDHIIVDVKDRILARRLLSVTLYDSFQEFEGARVREMSQVKDQTGLNFS